MKNTEGPTSAQVVDEERLGAQDGKFLTFSLGDKEYGIDISFVSEIVIGRYIPRRQDLPAFVDGVSNIHGKVIPIIDMRLRFGMEEHDYRGSTCVLMMDINGISMGLIVDSVGEVLDIASTDIEYSPEVKNGEASRFVMGLSKVGEDVKILLDVQSLLAGHEIEQIREQTIS